MWTLQYQYLNVADADVPEWGTAKDLFELQLQMQQ